MSDQLSVVSGQLPVRCGCGGEAKVVKHEYYMCSSTYGVTCYKCGTATNQGFDTEVEAVTAWNRAMSGSAEEKLKAFLDGMSAEMKEERTAKVETVEKQNVFKCGECGQYFPSTSWGSPGEYCARCGAKRDWKEDSPMEYFESGGR